MSGWCSHPSETDGVSSHDRCAGGNTANPGKEYQPCPCSCHFVVEYECGNCGGDLAEASHWPIEEWDEADRPVHPFVHVSGNRVTGENCP